MTEPKLVGVESALDDHTVKKVRPREEGEEKRSGGGQAVEREGAQREGELARLERGKDRAQSLGHRLRDSASWLPGEFTQPRAHLSDHPCNTEAVRSFSAPSGRAGGGQLISAD